MTGFRAVVLVLSCGAIASNVTLLAAGYRHRDALVLRSLIVWYPLVGIVTSALILGYRLSAALTHSAPNLRDYTAILPTIGFLVAGTVGLRALGRVVGKQDLDKTLNEGDRRAE